MILTYGYRTKRMKQITQKSRKQTNCVFECLHANSRMYTFQ